MFLRYTYTSDQRFRAIHKVMSEDYLLQIFLKYSFKSDFDSKEMPGVGMNRKSFKAFEVKSSTGTIRLFLFALPTF